MLKLHFLHRVGDHFCCVIVAISNKFVAIPLLFDSTKFHKILYINKIHLLPEFFFFFCTLRQEALLTIFCITPVL